MTAIATSCCQQWEAGAVTDHIEHALAPGERRRWDAHLDGCPRCARLLAEMRAVIRLLGTLSD